MKKAVRTLKLMLVVFLSSPFLARALDAPRDLTLDGRLYNSTSLSDPLLDGNVLLRIQILDKNKTCVIYEEAQTISTLNSNGYFNLKVGSALLASKRTAADPGNSMEKLFQNRTLIGATNTGCASGYTPVAGDERYLRLFVTPSSGTQDQLADMVLNSVPTAMVAETLQGLGRANVLELGTVTDLTQTNMESLFSASNYTKLNSLVGGTSAQYVQSSATGGAPIPQIAGNPGSPAVGSVWYDSVANVLKYYDGAVKTIANSSGSTVVVNGGQNGAVSAGTNDASSFSLKSNGVVRATFDGTTGGLGIGTASPAGALDVQGGTAASGNGTPINIVAQAGFQTGATVGGDVNITAGAGHAAFAVANHGNIVLTGATQAFYSNSPYSNGPYYNFQTSASAMLQTGSSPDFVSINPGILQSGSAGYTALKVNASETTVGTGAKLLADFQTGGLSKFTVTSAGNIGIGTNVPATALDVNGAQSFRAIAVPALSPANQGRLYYDSTANKFKMSQNGSAYVDLVTSGGVGGGQDSSSSLNYNSNSDGTGADGGFNFQSGGSSIFNIANNGDVSVVSTTAGSSIASAALKVAGGVGIAGALNVGLGITGNPITAQNASTTPYAATSVSLASPAFSSGAAVLRAANSSPTDGSAAYLSLSATNATPTAQNAYIGAVSTTGAGFAPSIVIGQQTASPGYTERVRIDPTGKVGIGTQTPTTGALLEINGTGVANSSVLIPRDSTANRPTTGVKGMIRYNTSTDKFEGYQGTTWADMIATGDFLKNGSVAMTGALAMGGQTINGNSTASGNLSLESTSGSPKGNVLVASGGGGVGIGTSSVTSGYVLDVVGNSRFAGSVSSNANITAVGFKSAASGGTMLTRWGTVTQLKPSLAGETVQIADSNNVGLMTVLENGNVGIATATPGQKLDVNGTINASAITIAGTPVGTSTSSYWNQASSNLSYTLGKVGIGTATPSTNLHIYSTYGGSTGPFLVSNNNGPVMAIDQFGNVKFDYNLTIGYDPNTTTWAYGAYGNNYITSGTGGGNHDIIINPSGTGKVGIGTATPGYKLDVNGTLRAFTITDSSDVRLKKEIKPLDQSLEKVQALRGVSYYWKDAEHGKGEQVGLIAQEVEQVYPELVETDAKGWKSVNYSHFVAPLIEAVKSLINMFNDHSREIASLKERALKAERETSALKNYICRKDPGAEICR